MKTAKLTLIYEKEVFDDEEVELSFLVKDNHIGVLRGIFGENPASKKIEFYVPRKAETKRVKKEINENKGE
jgi:hypothetical protein